MKSRFVYKNVMLLFCVMIFALSFCCVNLVYASKDATLKKCEYSKEYLAWMELSEEEKKDSFMPPVCANENTDSDRFKVDFNKTFGSLNLIRTSRKYDPRGTAYEGTIRDQMDTQSCWAFSAATSLEIFVNKNLSLKQIYSARHIEYATSNIFLNNKINEKGFNRTVDSGGHIFYSSAYFVGQVGPVLESDMPFENNANLIDISKIDKKVQLDVNGITMNTKNGYNPCDSKNISEMKETILRTGALAANVYFDGLYYNGSTGALYYPGNEYPNHAVTIVGWDDDYSVDNFKSGIKPLSSGAWLVQNSWGSEFGLGGYNYISYEDTKICSVYMAIEDVDTELEDNAYIHDKLGYYAYLGYKLGSEWSNSGHGMVVFDKKEKREVLKEVTFAAKDTGQYKIYFAEGDASSKNVSQMIEIGSGSITHGGYITHKLDHDVYIDASVTKFSIVVKWILDTNQHLLPVSVNDSDPDYNTLTIKPGQSFVSYKGDVWQDLYGENAVISIKAFTNDISYSVISKVDKVEEQDDGHVSVDLDFLASNVMKDDIRLVVTDSKNNIQKNVDVTYEVDEDNYPVKANLKFNNMIDNGVYYINIYSGSSYVNKVSFNVEFGIISNVYNISNINKTIYISKSVSVSEFLSKISGNVDTLKNSDGVVNSGYVGTGMTIDDYVIVLRGDVTGDGLVKVNDVMMISKFTVEGIGLDKAFYKTAADVTGDRYVKVNDVMMISIFTVEGGNL